ncbi:unnamed protein product, partial [Rotaria socialis]
MNLKPTNEYKRQRLDKDDRRNEIPIWLKLTNEKFR